MFGCITSLIVLATIVLLAQASPAPPACECPKDKFHDSGVLINVWPQYQCAYPDGACTWYTKTGELLNKGQTNCPFPAVGATTCLKDNNGDAGVLINHLFEYQCAYPHGACTWDSDGFLENRAQTNCAPWAKCLD